MKETGKKLNNQALYSSEIEEYTFAIGKGKKKTNVIVKLDICPEDDISNEKIAEGLVKYINAFEEILTWQSENYDAIMRLKGEGLDENAVSYVRVSSEDQKKHGYSIGQQITNNMNFALMNGYTIVKTFKDEGISSKDLNRPALQ